MSYGGVTVTVHLNLSAIKGTVALIAGVSL